MLIQQTLAIAIIPLATLYKQVHKTVTKSLGLKNFTLYGTELKRVASL